MPRKLSIRIICILSLLLVAPLQADEYEWDTSVKKDVPIVLSAVALNLSAIVYQESIDPLSSTEIERLETNDIISFDRCATSWYNPDLDKISDYTLLFGALIPALVSFAQDDGQNFNEDMLIYGEILALQAGIGQWCKALSKRERPYMYNENVSEEKKQGLDARFSFFSLHTSTAFSAAVYGSYLYEKKGGENSTLFWIANLALASTTAGLRLASGEHFPTDVIVGALVGSSLAYLFAQNRMHKKSISIYPTQSPKLMITVQF